MSGQSLENYEPLAGLVLSDKSSEEEVRAYINTIRAELGSDEGSFLDLSRAMNARLWRSLTRTEPPEDARNFLEALHRQHKVKPGSVVWYAAALLESNDIAREALRQPNWEGFFFASFQMGHDFATLCTLSANKKAIHLGMTQSKTLKDARIRSANYRKQQKDSKHAPWVAEARKIWRATPKLGVRACALKIISRIKLPLKSERTVRDAIKPHDPKKVGSAK